MNGPGAGTRSGGVEVFGVDGYSLPWEDGRLLPVTTVVDRIGFVRSCLRNRPHLTVEKGSASLQVPRGLGGVNGRSRRGQMEPPDQKTRKGLGGPTRHLPYPSDETK